MPISSVSSGVTILSAISSTGSAAPINASSPTLSPVATSWTASADTVVLSPAAQQSLATGTTSPPDDAAPPDALTQAIAILNDTSSMFSVSDQLQAYGQVATSVLSPQHTDFIANFVPGQTAPANPYTAAKGDAIVALMDSPFGQHAQQLLDQVGSYMGASGLDQLASTRDRMLTAFDGLSASDQQIYVGVTGLMHQMQTDGTAIATVDDYRANQMAQSNVDRALQAALTNPAYATAISQELVRNDRPGVMQSSNDNITDLAGLAAAAGDTATVELVKLVEGQQHDTVDWTQQAQSHFASYGPPPAPVPTAPAGPMLLSPDAPPPGYQEPDGKALTAALAATWDTTGKVSVTDQTAAQLTLTENVLFRQHVGGVAEYVLNSFDLSPFQKRTQAAAADFFWNPAVQAAASGNSDPTSTPSELDLLNKLPAEQQQLIFAGAGLNTPNTSFVGDKMIYYGDKMIYYPTLDAWKSQLAQDHATQIAAYQGSEASSSTSPAVNVFPTASAAPSKTSNTLPLAAVASMKLTYNSAEVALIVLQKAAKDTATAKAANSKNTNDTTHASPKTLTLRTSGAANQQMSNHLNNTVSVTA